MTTRVPLVLTILAAFLALVIVTGCEGPKGDAGPAGPAGPQGPAGPTGPAGSGFNMEGFRDSLACGTCHSVDIDSVYFVTARVYQWQASKHAYGGDYERNSAACARCHSTEGYIRYMNGRPAIDILQPSPMGCFSCHSPHVRGDFSLRTVAPQTIESQVVGVANATFDYGPGNQCVSCHMTRTMSPKMDGAPAGDSLRITTSRWYGHYGVQGQMLMGTGGFQFPGYTYTGNSFHTNATPIREQGCGICHMANPIGGGAGRAGGHTMNLRYEFHGAENYLTLGCRTSGCHSTMANLDYRGTQTEVHTLLDSLFHMLGRRGWVDTVETSSNFGLVRASGTAPLVIRPAIRAGAIYNYFFVEHDLSLGVHNAPYAKELLRSSIEHLNNNP